MLINRRCVSHNCIDLALNQPYLVIQSPTTSHLDHFFCPPIHSFIQFQIKRAVSITPCKNALFFMDNFKIKLRERKLFFIFYLKKIEKKIATKHTLTKSKLFFIYLSSLFLFNFFFSLIFIFPLPSINQLKATSALGSKLGRRPGLFLAQTILDFGPLFKAIGSGPLLGLSLTEIWTWADICYGDGPLTIVYNKV